MLAMVHYILKFIIHVIYGAILCAAGGSEGAL